MNTCINFFKNYHNLCNSDNDIQLCIDNFRDLRNICANGGSEVQNVIIANPKLVELSFNILQKLNKNSNCNDLQIKCFQVGIQFIGNLIVSNKINKALIFVKYYQILRTWLFNKNQLVRNNTEMVIYNILIDIQDLEDEILSDDKVLEQIIGDASEDIEFGSLLLEKLIADHFAAIYANVSDLHQEKLLLFTRHSLLNHDIIISNDSINFVKKITEEMLELFDKNEFESPQTVKLVEMLKILSRVTYVSKYENLLKSDDNFISLIIEKLTFIHKKGYEGNNLFTPYTEFDEIGSAELPFQPFYGIKTILIQIIGNLCYRNRIVQDKIRESHLIPIIIDCCKFDAKNPFIMQWAIFTLANLSYNNVQNKQTIATSLPSDYIKDSRVKFITDN